MLTAIKKIVVVYFVSLKNKSNLKFIINNFDLIWSKIKELSLTPIYGYI